MHKLVQEAAQYGISVKGFYSDGGERVAEAWPGAGAYFAHAALQIAGNFFPERTHETWPLCERYLAHAIRLTEWAESFKKEVEASSLLTRISDYLYDRDDGGRRSRLIREHTSYGAARSTTSIPILSGAWRS